MQMNFNRCVQFIGFHHWIIMVNMTVIALLCILLAGSSADRPVIRDIYLLGVSYVPVNGSGGFDLRVGYFGICAREIGSRSQEWTCDSDGKKLGFDAGDDPMGIIAIARNFKDGVIFSGIIIAAVVLASLATFAFSTFPGWQEERAETGSIRQVKPFPRREITLLIFAALFISGMLQLVGSLWQHVAATAAKSVIASFGGPIVGAHIGQRSTALTWVACFLLVMSASMLRVMMDSIVVLANAFENEDDDIYISLLSRRNGAVPTML